MASTTSTKEKEIVTEILPFIRVYKDGSIERLLFSPNVPPSLDPEPHTGVSSKDVTISPSVSARLFLPKLTQVPHQKFPILVYFHGGGFMAGCAFSSLDHRYVASIVSQAHVLAVSVEYRLAPEHSLPAAYEDCWVALQWVASHHSVDDGLEKAEPWILDHGDFDGLFIGGDSAGGNVAHNMAMRASVESLNGNVKVLGAFMCHPYFCSSKPVGNEPVENHEKTVPYVVWEYVYPSAPFGLDNPMINPAGIGAASLAMLSCSRLFVCVAEKDELLRERGVWYYNLVNESGWKGELELFEVEGEEHCFHIWKIESEKAKDMIKRLASFLRK